MLDTSFLGAHKATFASSVWVFVSNAHWSTEGIIRSSRTEAMGMLEPNPCGSFLQPLWLFERRSLLILLVVLRQPRFHRPDSDVQFVDPSVSAS